MDGWGGCGGGPQGSMLAGIPELCMRPCAHSYIVAPRPCACLDACLPRPLPHPVGLVILLLIKHRLQGMCEAWRWVGEGRRTSRSGASKRCSAPSVAQLGWGRPRCFTQPASGPAAFAAQLAAEQGVQQPAAQRACMPGTASRGGPRTHPLRPLLSQDHHPPLVFQPPAGGAQRAAPHRSGRAAGRQAARRGEGQAR